MPISACTQNSLTFAWPTLPFFLLLINILPSGITKPPLPVESGIFCSGEVIPLAADQQQEVIYGTASLPWCTSLSQPAMCLYLWYHLPLPMQFGKHLPDVNSWQSVSGSFKKLNIMQQRYQYYQLKICIYTFLVLQCKWIGQSTFKFKIWGCTLYSSP